ncbi:MAG: pseudouridine synthase [Lysobacterales bacterium CG02_land_8_20_14_3_00_62_12]|nr:MAG: pseudouridine synthase [Xanthomonadales bacterium CG02_land_8_20_14_3_00_62_12]
MLPALPTIDGLRPSRLQLRPGPWLTVLDGLCAHFPQIGRACWLDRMARGRVLDAAAQPITEHTDYRVGAEIRYYREVPAEPRLACAEAVLWADEHLVVADKPHFLPVTPSGGYVADTLLARLLRRLDNPQLVPLHRIDRATAGLVLFSANAQSRARYQQLFPARAIDKTYEALAAPLPMLSFPQVRRSRLLPGQPFFRTAEVAGMANSETHIGVIERHASYWRYSLQPVTGRQHQLRVHMAALGAPIFNDRWYPELCEAAPDDLDRPLQLLAKSLSFIDPVDGRPRHFESNFRLTAATD